VVSSKTQLIGFLAAMLLALAPARASTGLVNHATIVNLQPTTNVNLMGQAGVYFVYVNLPPGGPTCATYGQSSQRFATNPNTAAGMTIISTLLAALALGRNVEINGSGACDIWADTESIASVYTE
jgi:hypothetical protein